MLSGAYFLGRAALIEWVNNFLECHIEKVEECATGALYCNLWDALHPNTIQMSKVDFTVKQEFEYMKNWKVLQEGFQKAGVKKVIPVEKLIKAKYQDNLEFLQWMYQYAHQVYNGDCDNPQYNALERRSKSKGGKEYGSKCGRRQVQNSKIVKDNNIKEINFSSTRPTCNNNNNNINNTIGQIRSLNPEPTRLPNNRSNNEDFKQELDELRHENAKLQANNTALENKIESLSDIAKDIEKERDFYFNKVLKIEVLLKNCSDQSLPFIQAIFDILYQVDDENANDNKENINDAHGLNNNDVELIKQN